MKRNLDQVTDKQEKFPKKRVLVSTISLIGSKENTNFVLRNDKK